MKLEYVESSPTSYSLFFTPPEGLLKNIGPSDFNRAKQKFDHHYYVDFHGYISLRPTP